MKNNWLNLYQVRLHPDFSTKGVCNTAYNAENLGSVDQRVAKLLAIELCAYMHTLQPLRPKSVKAPSAQIRVRLGSNHSESLMASNFAVL